MNNKKETVLAYIEKDNSYLMLLRNKKKHDINANKWIGVGGHLEKEETPEDALIREIKEETGLDVISYSKKGLIHFNYDDEYNLSINYIDFSHIIAELRTKEYHLIKGCSKILKPDLEDIDEIPTIDIDIDFSNMECYRCGKIIV